MTLGSTQPLIEMSTRNLPGVQAARRVRLRTSLPSVSRLSRKCRNFDVSQPHQPPQFVRGIALLLPYPLDRRLGEPQTRSGCSGDDCPAHNLSQYRLSLSYKEQKQQLLYTGFRAILIAVTVLQPNLE
jgi:hypothetical protein